MKIPKNVLWMDIDTGELLTYSEMIYKCENEYDMDDYTNILEIFDIFEPTNIIYSD